MRGSARWSTVAPSRRSRSAVRSSTRDWAVRRASSSPVKRAFVIEFAGQLVGAQGGLGGAHFQLLDHALQVAALFATLAVGLVDRVGRLALVELGLEIDLALLEQILDLRDVERPAPIAVDVEVLLQIRRSVGTGRHGSAPGADPGLVRRRGRVGRLRVSQPATITSVRG